MTFGGALGVAPSEEEWVSGFQIGGAGTDALLTLPPSAELDAIVVEVKNILNNTGTNANNFTKMTWVKFAHVNSEGRYIGEAVRYDFAPVSGTGSSVVHPFQIAKVVTLDTGLRGPTRRGRMFLPAPADTVATDGTISGTAATSTASSIATRFTNINLAISGLGRVVVASNAGYNTPVTGVRCGRVLDTVRRRRRQLGEQYSAAAVVNP